MVDTTMISCMKERNEEQGQFLHFFFFENSCEEIPKFLGSSSAASQTKPIVSGSNCSN